MIYLGGGGSEIDEANVFEQAFQPGQHIIVWPWALPEPEHEGCLAWLSQAIVDKGEFKSLSLAKPPAFGLDAADIVVIPGGNTFDLLARLREHQLIGPLKNFASNGGKIYGGSAGAILMGLDIDIADATKGGLDDNTVGLRDTQGLGLVGDFVVFPHYEAANENHRTYCNEWASEHSVGVLGLLERGGVSVDSAGNAVNLGPSDVMVFRKDQDPEIWKAGVEMDLHKYTSN